ncbi:MAG: cobaltochelatase subunit CobN, partial [Candidatus Methanospirareceae archaeon]
MKIAKIVAITWVSDIPLLVEAAKEIGVELNAWSVYDMEDEDKREKCIRCIEEADIILYHPSKEYFWDEVIEKYKKDVPIISFGHEVSFWTYSNVPLEVVSTVNTYILYGGLGNIKNMLKYILKEVLGVDCEYEPPKEALWQGIYHPDAERVFESVEDYFAWYKPSHKYKIGILFYRVYWANRDLKVVDALIRELEKEFDVIPVFCYMLGDKELGAEPNIELIEKYFMGRIDALINLQSVLHAGDVDGSTEALKKLDVPVFRPVVLYNTTEEEWRADSQGMNSLEVAWSVAMPEFEGVIEPIIIGAVEKGGEEETKLHAPIEDRIKKIVERIKRWVRLRDKPRAERKVAFILHNNPCASVEATVGSAANLDALESVARILNRMREEGYLVENPPENGKELIEDIMNRKAISEFRWTTVEEIVSKGGAIAMISEEDYKRWFDTLSEDARRRMCEVWGVPPGEAREGVPAAMLYDDKIVITGVRYGNVVVCVQPKRGCAGARCDGQVCKILHDPEVPPPHQYLATYHYLEDIFGADVIIHVGTHGNLEFLPGKSVALSKSCYPDIAIGNKPHLYIYNSDNPPEGTIAKRRSYATLIDHMQAVMTESGLYGSLKELEDNIAEYKRVKASDKARAHALEHIIIDLIRESKLSEEIKLEERLKRGESIENIIEAAHDVITRIYNTQIPDGMHIFGEMPRGRRKVEFIHSILRNDTEIRRLIFDVMGIDEEPSEVRSEVLMEVDGFCKELIAAFLDNRRIEEVETLRKRLKRREERKISIIRDKVLDISSRIDASDEMRSLFHGMDGGYIEPGPSGLITRGKVEVLPTGRNFYSLDPFKVPTRAAWEVGKKLAEALIEKYKEENGKIPENVAMYWMSSDIMWADGEQLAQILYLIGVEPVWKDGRVKSFRIIPLEELGRPRIDVTIRVSGITRDCFYNCIELLDEAIKKVAMLNEPIEMNYIRKHAMENKTEDGKKFARIFSSKPGTYGSGVNLAVYASAWREEKDLADVFIDWNGYAYGKGVFGEEAKEELVSMLKTVDLTFNKTVTDEYDLFGCCCYFSAHGGLTVAARDISGREVSTYYGDTRDRDRIEVRTLADEIRRVVRTKLLNPRWIEGMKRHGYKGAGDISKRVGRVYGWEATTREVDDWIFDEIAKTFILDEEMRRFFEENNPWALEEIGRRLLEAYERGLWDADKEVIERLREAYLEMEGWIEEKMGDVKGNFQGGAIDVITREDLKEWKEKMEKVRD